MIGWIVLAVYLLGLCVGFTLLGYFGDDVDDQTEWAIGTLLWPVVLLPALCYWAGGKAGR